MRRSAAITLLCSSLLALTGCKSPCRELSDRLCNCVQKFQRDDCITLAADRERSAEPTGEELELCEQKLETCDPRPLEEEDDEPRAEDDPRSCSYLQRDEGKEACGLAR